jgi:hypothetical protein
MKSIVKSVHTCIKRQKTKVAVLKEEQLRNSLSIYCLRQHVSSYRPKLTNIIDKKYYHEEIHSHIIIIDFRLALFDSLSLERLNLF